MFDTFINNYFIGIIYPCLIYIYECLLDYRLFNRNMFDGWRQGVNIIIRIFACSTCSISWIIIIGRFWQDARSSGFGILFVTSNMIATGYYGNSLTIILDHHLSTHISSQDSSSHLFVMTRLFMTTYFAIFIFYKLTIFNFIIILIVFRFCYVFVIYIQKGFGLNRILR